MTTREMQASAPLPPPRDYNKYNTRAVVAREEIRFEYRAIGELPDVFLRAYGDNALHALKKLKQCIKARCEELAI